MHAIEAIRSVAAAFAAPAAIADTVKVAFIEGLSGSCAPIGQNQLRALQTFAETANQQNWTGQGHKIEFVGFDGKVLSA